MRVQNNKTKLRSILIISVTDIWSTFRNILLYTLRYSVDSDEEVIVPSMKPLPGEPVHQDQRLNWNHKVRKTEKNIENSFIVKFNMKRS